MKNKKVLLTIVVIISILLVISSIVILIVKNTNKNREYDEQEVLAAAVSLIKKSEKLNELYYGKGILHTQDTSAANGYYYPADTSSLRKFGVSTIKDIENLTRECYTVSLSNNIISTKLSSVSDEDGILAYARYYQKYDTLDTKKEECIMVYINSPVYLTDEIEYDYESLSVSGVKGEEVFVTIKVTVTNSEGKTQTKDLEISLLEEENGWRINSPTYVKYFDRQEYDDLQKNKNKNK